MYFRILHSDRPFAEKDPFFLPKMKVCFNALACATYVRFTNVKCTIACMHYKGIKMLFPTIKQQWNFWMGIIYYVKMNFYTIPTPVLQFLFFFNYSTVFPKMVGSIEFSPPLLPKNQTNQYVQNISNVFLILYFDWKKFQW